MTADEQILSLDVDPNESVENVKALLEVETQVPLQRQQLLYNGKEMKNFEKLSGLGVKDEDLIMMVSAGASSAPTNNLSFNPDGSAVNPEAFQQHIRRDSNTMAQLFQSDPELAQAIVGNDLNNLQQILRERHRQRSVLQRQQEEEMALLYADPFDVEAQKKIEAAIRQKKILGILGPKQPQLPPWTTPWKNYSNRFRRRRSIQWANPRRHPHNLSARKHFTRHLCRARGPMHCCPLISPPIPSDVSLPGQPSHPSGHPLHVPPIAAGQQPSKLSNLSVDPLQRPFFYRNGADQHHNKSGIEAGESSAPSSYGQPYVRGLGINQTYRRAVFEVSISLAQTDLPTYFKNLVISLSNVPSNYITNSVAFSARSLTHDNGKPILVCEHCKKQRHTKDQCWKLHSQPPRGMSQSLGLISVDETNPWILDSGATDHLIGFSEHFVSYTPCASNEKIWIADGSLAPIAGKGQGRLPVLIVYVDGIVLSRDDQAEISQLKQRVGMLGCRPTDTPIEFNRKLGNSDDQVPVDKEQYQRLVGKSIYLSHTRPDISFVGNLVTWRSKKQSVVARSSVDRTKHVEIDRHFIKERLDSGSICIPYIPSSQQKGIDENWAAALEHNPEAFARVVMLYVDMEVNGVPLKAFVDSGAQSTIISKSCAEKCGYVESMHHLIFPLSIMA
ncbi:DNA damage-inducible protein 1 isoform X3 [Cucumis melo var. makuwa]|uniref:DNA damage-inducible protein 1 isoform X3 n=1 Tax=Cucumis melo var. makuwa TaxID=1194695 RepID=A0A5D3DI12_CUCMM|nr:DNA damage-inducible protein 1 isoform X3 [Cucumis melo var. makuwa]